MARSASIPLIDLVDGDEAVVARQLVDAAAEHGFIYIRNLGRDIPVADIDDMFELARVLFATPVEEKQRCKIQTDNRGWAGLQVETLDPKNQRVGDFKEAFNFGDFVDRMAQQPLPSTIAAYEGRISAFRDICQRLSEKILYLLGVGLGVDPPSFFSAAHLRSNGPSSTTLRINYYPPQAATSAESTDMRAGAHSDYGSITLLFRLRGQAGLEIQAPDGRSWAPVPVSPAGAARDPAPPVLVNVGDLLSYWTNGLLRSVVHRVVFSGGDTVPGESDRDPRYSLAYFCHPVGTMALGPVPSARVRDFVDPREGRAANPYAERKVLTADEHLQMRLKSSYIGLYDEEPAGAGP